MTLTTAGKNWLATNAGVSGCFSPTGVTFQDADGVSWNMGTKDVVTSFVGAHMAAKNDVIIVADTTYNGFKAINGGDIGYTDVTLVYNSDGHTGATLPLYCAPAANIVSTVLTLSTYSCTEPCNVTGSVSWRNDGDAAGTLTPAILVNGNPVSIGSNESIDPAQIITHGFSLAPNLTSGTYEVCASPGTHCQTLTVLVSEIFTSIPSGATIYIDDSETASGATPLTIGLTIGDHTYIATHASCTDASGSFTTSATEANTVDVRFASSVRFESAPAGKRIWIEIDDIMTDTEVDTPGIVQTTTGTHAYKLTMLDQADQTGTVTIPNCAQVNVTPGGGMGPLMMGGLLFGAILMGRKKEEKGTQSAKKSAQVSRSNISNN